MYCTAHHSGYTVLGCTVQGCNALCCIVLCCATLYCTVLYSSTLYWQSQYCTALYSTALYCTQHCTALYSTVLHCTALYCTEQYMHWGDWAGIICRCGSVFVVCIVYIEPCNTKQICIGTSRTQQQSQYGSLCHNIGNYIHLSPDSQHCISSQWCLLLPP